MTPTVSVLVTVYNREEYLSCTLESILNSTFQDFEVIVVDDHSTDNSLDVAKRFAHLDCRIKVHSNEKNLGDYYNRNKAASLAKGKYLKYLDADDLIYRHGLSIMVEALEEFPAAALALSYNRIDPEFPYPFVHSPQELYRQHFLGKSVLGVGPSAAILRRNQFNAVGGFSGQQFVGDTELWLKLAEKWPVVTLPPSLVWWRQHEGQQMQLELTKPEVLNKRHELQLKMLKETKHLSESQKNKALRELKHLHARRILSFALRRKRPQTAWSLFRNSSLTIGELLVGLKRPSH